MGSSHTTVLEAIAVFEQEVLSSAAGQACHANAKSFANLSAANRTQDIGGSIHADARKDP